MQASEFTPLLQELIKLLAGHDWTACMSDSWSVERKSKAHFQSEIAPRKKALKGHSKELDAAVDAVFDLYMAYGWGALHDAETGKHVREHHIHGTADWTCPCCKGSRNDT